MLQDLLYSNNIPLRLKVHHLIIDIRVLTLSEAMWRTLWPLLLVARRAAFMRSMSRMLWSPWMTESWKGVSPLESGTLTSAPTYQTPNYIS